MNISVFGLGYVGCVSSACLAHDGHTVIGIDVNRSKVEMLQNGITPIIEPGLGELIRDVVETDKFKVCMDSNYAVHQTDVSLICVGTPSNDNGSLKLDYVNKVCREIGDALTTKDGYHVVVIRSTVLPGTVEQVIIPILEKTSKKRAGADFGVCMIPEFLREGSAIKDYYDPSLVVIGELDLRSGDSIMDLYQAVSAEFFRTPIQTAEMVKYVSNAFHALKIVFANEIGQISKSLGIDGQQVMDIFCADERLNISKAYLKPGFAFGGSCLPKDVRAFLYRSRELNLKCEVLESILPSNQKHIEASIKMVEKTGSKRVGIFGISFKPDTDDLRESPAIVLAETLLGKGYSIKIFDDNVELSRLIGANKAYLENEIPHIASLMSLSMEELISDSEVIVITNSNKVFRKIPMMMNKHQVLIDFVGIAKEHKELVDKYHGIGW
jgi:GDP-mannose 6-dehydrogenase